MLTALGDHRFDVTHRAVVIHRLDASTPRPELRRRASVSPADALLLTPPPGGHDDALPESTAAIREVIDRPVIVRTSDTGVLSDCLAAGAAGAHPGADVAGPAYLRLAAHRGATVIVAHRDPARVEPSARADALLALAAQVRAAGIGPERVVVDVTPSIGGVRATEATSVGELAVVARAGFVAMIELSGNEAVDDDDEAELAAAASLLVAGGARVLVMDRPRTVRRVAAVLAELLFARRRRDEVLP